MPEVQAPPTLPKSQPFFGRRHSTILKLLGVGALFLVIIFTAFFLFEVTTQQKIHPFQYLMIGAVLCLFYLLLLSISEFIGFSWAYLIARGGIDRIDHMVLPILPWRRRAQSRSLSCCQPYVRDAKN